MNFSMPLMARGGLFVKKRMCTAWPKPTRRFHIIDGNEQWHLKMYYIRRATSVSWLTLMRVRQPRPKEFSTIQGVSIRLARFMKEQRQWIGWNRSKNAVLRLHLR